MLQTDNYENAWVFVNEAVVGGILNKGGAEENDVAKLPLEGATQLIQKILRLP